MTLASNDGTWSYKCFSCLRIIASPRMLPDLQLPVNGRAQTRFLGPTLQISKRDMIYRRPLQVWRTIADGVWTAKHQNTNQQTVSHSLNRPRTQKTWD